MKSKLFSLTIAIVFVTCSSAVYAANIKVGASLPLTGGFAVPGKKHLEGYEMCIDMINSKGGWLGRRWN